MKTNDHEAPHPGRAAFPPSMTTEEFSRINDVPASTVRRFIRRHAQRAGRPPAEIGVTEGGTERDPAYTVSDPGRLLAALTRHRGSGAIPPASVLRLHQIGRHALDTGALPPGIDADAFRDDLDVLLILLPNRAP